MRRRWRRGLGPSSEGTPSRTPRRFGRQGSARPEVLSLPKLPTNPGDGGTRVRFPPPPPCPFSHKRLKGAALGAMSHGLGWVGLGIGVLDRILPRKSSWPATLTRWSWGRYPRKPSLAFSPALTIATRRRGGLRGASTKHERRPLVRGLPASVEGPRAFPQDACSVLLRVARRARLGGASRAEEGLRRDPCRVPQGAGGRRLSVRRGVRARPRALRVARASSGKARTPRPCPDRRGRARSCRPA